MSGRIVALRHVFRRQSTPRRFAIRVSSAQQPRRLGCAAQYPRSFSSSPALEELEPVAEPAQSEERVAASPYVVSAEVVIYEAPAVVPELVADARRKVTVGAGLASVGFAAVGACIVTTATPTTLALLVAALSVNAATLASYTQKSLLGLASQHVEKISLLPLNTEPKQEQPCAAQSGEQEQGTAEERLAATDKVRLLVRSANVDRTLLLTNVAAAWQGARYAGLVSDDRIEFVDVCQRLRLLDADPSAATSSDEALVEALFGTSKVIAEEHVECRTDIPEVMRPPADFPGLRLSAKTRSDVKRVPMGIPRSPPTDGIKSLGKRAIRGGVIMLCGAAFFVFEKNKGELSIFASKTPFIERRKQDS